MKRIGTFFILLGLLLCIGGYKKEIMNFLIHNLIGTVEVDLKTKNEYYLDYKFNYIENVEEFSIANKKDLLNLYYTVINSGTSTFEFHCPESYTRCIKDVVDIANNQNYLSDINGFVHPFNSFDTVETTYDSLGRVKLKIVKTYTDVEIEELNKKVKEIITNEVKNKKESREIIKIIHDYIINNTVYDKLRADDNVIKYSSNTAYGVLFEGYGICSGYADAMALFLNYYKIPNYKVVSQNHVWNAVYLDDKWYHLDLTWDDPISDDGKEILDYTYFLITDDELKEINDAQHKYDATIFSEFVTE